MSKLFSYFKFLLLANITMILSNCGHPCYDADDFGLPKFYISSEIKNDSELLAENINNRHVKIWTDTELNIIGDRLIIIVRPPDEQNDSTSYMYAKYNPYGGVSIWSPWGKSYVNNIFDMKNECRFLNDKMCYAGRYEAPMVNAPCYLKNGIGLYMLILAKDAGDPNDSPLSSMNPEAFFGDASFVYHLGEKTNNLANANYSDIPKNNFTEGKLYFKILDNLYKDNLGGYQVIIKNGAVQGTGGRIATLSSQFKSLITDKLRDAQKEIFKNTVRNSSFRSIVNISLIIYIIYLGFKITIGIAEFSQKEFIIRTFKIGIIFALLSDTSWEFFSNYFLNIFIGGIDKIIMIVNGDNNANIFASLDRYISQMFSSETSTKMWAAIWGSNNIFVAAFGVMILVMSIIVIILLMAKALILYTLCLIAITIIISLAPIFLIFILFDFAKDLFNLWLSQLIANLVEIVMIMAFLALFMNSMLSYLHYILGYKVCFTGARTILTKEFGFSKPSIDFTKKSNILVPEAYIKTDGTSCAPYECTDLRYVDLPYLDLEKDKNRIDEIKAGNYVTIYHVIVLILTIYFMYSFFDNVSRFSRYIVSSSSYLMGGLGETASGIVSSWTGLATAAPTALLDKVTGGRFTEIINKPRDAIRDFSSSVTESLNVGKTVRKIASDKTKEILGINDIDDSLNYLRIEKIGRKIDAYQSLAKMTKGQLLHSVGGIFGFGKDYNEKVIDPSSGEKTNLTQRDLTIELAGKDLGWSKEKIDSTKVKAAAAADSIKKNGKFLKLALIGGAVGSLALGGVALVGGAVAAGIAGKRILNKYKEAGIDRGGLSEIKDEI